jgi:hypothetical protein
MPSLSESAERAACHVAVFRAYVYEFDGRSADEVIWIAQALSAVPRLDDDRNLDERRDGHQAASAASMKARRSGSRCRIATRAEVSMTIQCGRPCSS